MQPSVPCVPTSCAARIAIDEGVSLREHMEELRAVRAGVLRRSVAESGANATVTAIVVSTFRCEAAAE